MSTSSARDLDPSLGWPFLVAAGRRRDHLVVLAPDFLVAQDDYGFLAEAVTPIGDSEPVRTMTASSWTGRPLSVTYRSHLLTPHDILGDGSGAASAGAARDEHNRPLRLLHGFVSATSPHGDVEADVDECWVDTLAAYRAFLADEQGHEVVAAPGLPLRSVGSATRGDSGVPVSVFASRPLAAPSRSQSGLARRAEQRVGAGRAGGGIGGTGLVLPALLTLLALAVVIMLGSRFLSSPTPVPSPPSPTTCTTEAAIPEGAPAPTPTLCPTTRPGA